MIDNARPAVPTCLNRCGRALVRVGASRAILLLGALLLGGCYRYVPSDTDGLRRGDPVRAQVSGVPVEVGDIAVRDVTTVDGEFVSIMDQQVYLSAMRVTNRAGREFDGLRSTVAIERTSLDGLFEKRLDVTNTALAAAALTAGAVLLHTILDSAGGISGQGSGGGGGGGAQ